MRKALIVEDDVMMQQFAETVLQSLGWETEVTSSAQTALQRIEGDEPLDLLFVDVRLQGKNEGGRLADAAKALRPALRILVTSGARAEDGDVDTSHAFIKKPYRLRHLADALERLEDGRSGDAAEAGGDVTRSGGPPRA